MLIFLRFCLNRFSFIDSPGMDAPCLGLRVLLLLFGLLLRFLLRFLSVLFGRGRIRLP